MSMSEHEERLLRQRADEVRKQAESLQEERLYAAMRNGIKQGRQRERRRGYRQGILGAVAVAAVVWLVFSMGGTLQNSNVNDNIVKGSVQSDSTSVWNDYQIYRQDDARLNPALARALEQNLVQPVRQRAENGDYTLDVAGAVTDGRQVFVLFSVQNRSDTKMMIGDFWLQFGDVQNTYPYRGASLDFVGRGGNGISPGETVNYVFSNKLSPAISYDRNVKLDITLSPTYGDASSNHSNQVTSKFGLEVAFGLDQNMLKEQEHTVTPNRMLKVGEQQITVARVLYTPLAAYVDVEYSPLNSKHIFQLLNPVLVNQGGAGEEKLFYPTYITSDNSEVYTDGSAITLVFNSSRYSQPESASLRMAGIVAVDKERMKIVVDLNKEQLLAAPGDDLELVRFTPETSWEEGQVMFRQRQRDPYGSGFGIWLGDSFTDAHGEVHKRASKTAEGGSFGGYMSSSDGNNVDEKSYFFGPEAKDYPQPLTIPVERYWKPILDAQAVQLFSALE